MFLSTKAELNGVINLESRGENMESLKDTFF
jgi:hypothetical protein